MHGAYSVNNSYRRIRRGETSGQCGNNLTWSYNTETKTLTISGTGDMYNYGSYDAIPWYQYHSSIKNVSIGNDVTSIDNYVFSHCTSLISVTIPDSVTTIDENAFRYCTGLSSITVGTENEKYFSKR